MFYRVFVGLAILTLSACGDGGSASNNPPKDGTPNKPAPAPKKELVRKKPVYDVKLKTGEGDTDPSVVSWTAKVPTGGWTMKIENVLVEETTNKLAARILVIVEQPGPDEVVTQAEETLTGEYKDKRKIERVEFSGRLVVRGIDDPKKTLFGVDKTIQYPYDTK